MHFGGNNEVLPADFTGKIISSESFGYGTKSILSDTVGYITYFETFSTILAVFKQEI